MSKRIRLNEGFSNVVYKDQLGYLTIGYGHLIKKEDMFLSKKKYSKKILLKTFNQDLNIAITDFRNKYPHKNQPLNIKEVIIETIKILKDIPQNAYSMGSSTTAEAIDFLKENFDIKTTEDYINE